MFQAQDHTGAYGVYQSAYITISRHHVYPYLFGVTENPSFWTALKEMIRQASIQIL